MRHPAAALFVAATLLALALPAAADGSGWGIRLGVEAPFTTHTNTPATGQPRTQTIGDSFQPSVDVLLEQAPKDILSFGLEGRVGIESTHGYPRTGIAVGPEVTLNVPVVPIYLRAGLPVRVDPRIGDLGLRLAAGLKLNLSAVALYMEGAADMPLFGIDVSGRNERPLDKQAISIGAGIELRF